MKDGLGQFCPVAVASEVFARRWTPIILRELFAGSEQFNEIHRGMPLISRSLLARRLRELEQAGVIAVEARVAGKGHCYRLTQAGRELAPALECLGAWGQRWTVRVERRNLDPSVLMWNVRRRIALERLPERRVVVRFKFVGTPTSYRGPRLFWLLLERTCVDLCIEDPGFDVDVYVRAETTAMIKVWLGDEPFHSMLAAQRLQLEGSPALVAAFPSWLLLSQFAGVPRPALRVRDCPP